MGCIFCAIVAGQAPAHRIAESAAAVAFLDVNPATRGHTLIVPKRHAIDLFAIDTDDLSACAALAQQVAGHLRDTLGADGVNIMNSNGAAAWQSVFHFHLHVVPRYAGRDGLALPWHPAPADPADLESVAAELG